MHNNIIRSELLLANKLLVEFINNDENIISIEKAAKLISNSIEQNCKVISCGNGGSMSDAMHFAEEMLGNYRNKRIALPAIAISDSAFITCSANDFGFNSVFSRFIEAMGNKNDILFAISTSGNSENIVLAAEKAKEKGLKIIALTGKNGGQLVKLADVEIRAPYSEFSDRTQEIHIKIIHILIHLIEINLKLV